MKKVSSLMMVSLMVLSTCVLVVTASALYITVKTSKPSYQIGEEVYVYGNLTYNGLPLPDKLVSIEVQDPFNNTILMVVRQTNSEGAYNLTFRLPDQAEKGTYTVYVRSSYNEETATNHITFEVKDAALYVYPPTTWALVGNNFNVDVIVDDIVDLFGFEFYLSYNTTILDVLSVIIQPPFDEGFSPLIEIVEPEGYVHVASILLPSSPPLSGSFPLVLITFKAISLGSCLLDLYNTGLIDSMLNPIVHVSVDGYAFVVILGDVDGDGKVTMKDIFLLILHFGRKKGDARYAANCDINCDDVIDMKDIYIAIRNFNKSW